MTFKKFINADNKEELMLITSKEDYTCENGIVTIKVNFSKEDLEYLYKYLKSKIK